MPKGSCLFTFQSTLPAWGATKTSQCFSMQSNISIHAPRVGSDLAFSAADAMREISIHAPRVGSDSRRVYKDAGAADFNPRSPRGERRDADCPARRIHISIHAPRVGSDFKETRLDGLRVISIHAPRVGSDAIGAVLTYFIG